MGTLVIEKHINATELRLRRHDRPRTLARHHRGHHQNREAHRGPRRQRNAVQGNPRHVREGTHRNHVLRGRRPEQGLPLAANSCGMEYASVHTLAPTPAARCPHGTPQQARHPGAKIMSPVMGVMMKARCKMISKDFDEVAPRMRVAGLTSELGMGTQGLEPRPTD